MTSPEKIERPPRAENWVRMQYRDTERTARTIFNFLRSSPQWSYDPARKAVRYRIEDRLSREGASRVIEMSGNRLGRPYNLELVNAFYDYEAENPIDGVRAFDEFHVWYPLNRFVGIPVKPLTVIREEGAFTPIFLCPWSKIAFDGYQASLLMTILEDSVFNFTDFEDSVGKILFFPKYEDGDGEMLRKPVVWERGQFPLLGKSEIQNQIEIFFEGKRRAEILYQDYLASKGK